MKTSRPGGFPCQAGVHGDFQVCRLTASIAIIGITIIGISIIPSSMTETFNFISGRLQMDFLANLPMVLFKTPLRFLSSTVFKFHHDHQHDNYDDHQYDNNDDHQHNNDDDHQ